MTTSEKVIQYICQCVQVWQSDYWHYLLPLFFDLTEVYDKFTENIAVNLKAN